MIFTMFVIGLIIFSGPIAHAQKGDPPTITVRVRVETKPEPARAIGLIISTKGAQQIADTTIQKIGDKLYEILFSVSKDSLQPDSVATAMSVTAGGDIAFANITPALLSDARDMIANVPDCPSEDTSSIANVNQMGPLESLVEIRKARAELAQLKVNRALNPELLNKLKQFEEAFGLGRTEELSANLPPNELVDRLARINFAVQQYQASKK